MADGGNDDRFLVFVKDDAPVSDSQPGAAPSLQSFHVGVPRRRKLCQPLVNAVADVAWKLRPFARSPLR
jgi:hypothetical protein